ncbi:MAG: GNAT family N-acetyltransferase [Sulfolobales archaeon]
MNTSENLVGLYHRDFTRLALLREHMGFWHYFFASAVEKIGGGIVDLILSSERRLVGQGVFYKIATPEIILGVIYYLVIGREFRGKGFGRILLATLEEILSWEDAEIFIASTTLDNEASRRLFRSLDYKEFSWKDLYKLLGSEETEILRKALCSYEDDLIMIRFEKRDIKDLKKALNKENTSRKTIERIWREICYTPWLRLRRS